MIDGFLRQGSDIDVRVYGRHSGHIEYRRSNGVVEKTYVNFSDDGAHLYTGSERTAVNPGGYSTYTVDVTLSGPKPGVMDLRITFGPLDDELPARIVFAEDDSGGPLSHGYAEYGGKRLTMDSLVR